MWGSRLRGAAGGGLEWHGELSSDLLRVVSLDCAASASGGFNILHQATLHHVVEESIEAGKCRDSHPFNKFSYHRLIARKSVIHTGVY